MKYRAGCNTKQESYGLQCYPSLDHSCYAREDTLQGDNAKEATYSFSSRKSVHVHACSTSTLASVELPASLAAEIWGL